MSNLTDFCSFVQARNSRRVDQRVTSGDRRRSAGDSYHHHLLGHEGGQSINGQFAAALGSPAAAANLQASLAALQQAGQLSLGQVTDRERLATVPRHLNLNEF